MKEVLLFLAGLWLGGMVGVAAMCLCAAAGHADRQTEQQEQRLLPPPDAAP
ncbi:MAG: DUF3789 domain-containing protein [Clostridiales bacterium]|nr:DUF3789 domain-containing protein [Clostridiales bacterium]MCD8384993.1 DUF3789 domain-containing protein [Clostridiales bacterium]